MTTLKLPAKHALDWFSRCDDEPGQIVAQTARTATFDLTDDGLRDLISDALYYAEEMGPDNTGDIDYRPAARRCLAALDRLGVTYSRRGFTITLT